MSTPTPSEVVVRALTAGDLQEVSHLLVASQLCEREGVADRVQLLLHQAPSWCMGAVYERHLVGILLASYNGFHVFLSHIAVARAYQGHGIGTLLHAELVSRASKAGAHGVIADARLSAVGFFATLGYRLPGAIFLIRDVPG
jgi:GNAT superfamily N-acetyltransferase